MSLGKELWGLLFPKEGEPRYFNVRIVDKLFVGQNNLPYRFYMENLKPEENEPPAKKHVMVVAASEKDITLSDWFHLAIGSKWKVSLRVVNGKLRLRSVMWEVDEK
jgi:hypothetical protein